MPLLPRTLQTKAAQRRELGAVLKFATFHPPTETARRSSLQRSYLGKEEEIVPETLHRARRPHIETSEAETTLIRQGSTPSRHARRSEQEFDVRQYRRHPSRRGGRRRGGNNERSGGRHSARGRRCSRVRHHTGARHVVRRVGRDPRGAEESRTTATAAEEASVGTARRSSRRRVRLTSSTGAPGL